MSLCLLCMRLITAVTAVCQIPISANYSHKNQNSKKSLNYKKIIIQIIIFSLVLISTKEIIKILYTNSYLLVLLAYSYFKNFIRIITNSENQISIKIGNSKNYFWKYSIKRDLYHILKSLIYRIKKKSKISKVSNLNTSIANNSRISKNTFFRNKNNQGTYNIHIRPLYRIAQENSTHKVPKVIKDNQHKLTFLNSQISRKLTNLTSVLIMAPTTRATAQTSNQTSQFHSTKAAQIFPDLSLDSERINTDIDNSNSTQFPTDKDITQPDKDSSQQPSATIVHQVTPQDNIHNITNPTSQELPNTTAVPECEDHIIKENSQVHESIDISVSSVTAMLNQQGEETPKSHNLPIEFTNSKEITNNTSVNSINHSSSLNTLAQPTLHGNSHSKNGTIENSFLSISDIALPETYPLSDLDEFFQANNPLTPTKKDCNHNNSHLHDSTKRVRNEKIADKPNKKKPVPIKIPCNQNKHTRESAYPSTSASPASSTSSDDDSSNITPDRHATTKHNYPTSKFTKIRPIQKRYTMPIKTVIFENEEYSFISDSVVISRLPNETFINTYRAKFEADINYAIKKYGLPNGLSEIDIATYDSNIRIDWKVSNRIQDMTQTTMVLNLTQPVNIGTRSKPAEHKHQMVGIALGMQHGTWTPGDHIAATSQIRITRKYQFQFLPPGINTNQLCKGSTVALLRGVATKPAAHTINVLQSINQYLKQAQVDTQLFYPIIDRVIHTWNNPQYSTSSRIPEYIIRLVSLFPTTNLANPNHPDAKKVKACWEALDLIYNQSSIITIHGHNLEILKNASSATHTNKAEAKFQPHHDRLTNTTFMTAISLPNDEITAAMIYEDFLFMSDTSKYLIPSNLEDLAPLQNIFILSPEESYTTGLEELHHAIIIWSEAPGTEFQTESLNKIYDALYTGWDFHPIIFTSPGLLLLTNEIKSMGTQYIRDNQHQSSIVQSTNQQKLRHTSRPPTSSQDDHLTITTTSKSSTTLSKKHASHISKITQELALQADRTDALEERVTQQEIETVHIKHKITELQNCSRNSILLMKQLLSNAESSHQLLQNINIVEPVSERAVAKHTTQKTTKQQGPDPHGQGARKRA